MINRYRERGEGRIGFIVTAAVFVLGIWVATRVLPVRINGYQFREKLRDEARLGVTIKDDGELRKRILRSASELQIPLEAKNVKIERTTSEIVINTSYEQPVDLKVTTYTYKFDVEQRSPLF